MGEQAGTIRGLFDEEYGGLVRLATLITGDPAAAEDVVQEAFARALARWNQLRTYDKPGAWVRRVTIRLAVRHRGRRAREVALVDAPATDATPPDPELLAALLTLPANQRAALVLFYFEGYSTDEVASELGIKPATARSHLHRGRAALAQQLALPEVTVDGH